MKSFRECVLAREGLSEGDAVSLFGESFASQAAGLRVGIGDDAAVVESVGAPWVCSVDASVEGVHFAYDYLSLEDIGYRAFQAALSDLAAMGARPRAALSSLIVPRGFGRSKLARLSRGQAESARVGGCPIVGGNLSRGRELSLTTTVFGHAERPLLRSAAQPGHELWLIGSLGRAAAGLASLRGGRAPASELAPAFERCIGAWRRPRALIERGLSLVGVAGAAIDVSDGLVADAGRVARASGVSIQIERERLRAALGADLILVSRALRRSPLHFALYGGEDYALLATGPRVSRPSFAQAIGHVSRGQGLWLVHRGQRLPLLGGYDHLRNAG